MLPTPQQTIRSACVYLRHTCRRLTSSQTSCQRSVCLKVSIRTVHYRSYAHRAHKPHTMPKPPQQPEMPLPHNISISSITLDSAATSAFLSQHTIRHKQLDYGARHFNEDGKFGLAVPSEPTDCIQTVIDTFADAVKPYAVNRASVRCLHPGAHTKPASHFDVYNTVLIIVPVGSHTVIKLQPVDTSDTTLHEHDIVVHDGHALILTDDACTTYTWSVNGKTRDWINDQQIKRKEMLLVALRSIKPVDEQQRILDASQSDVTPSDNDRKMIAVPVSDSTQLNAQLEATHVHTVYDSIAGHFSSTRHSPWPKIDAFVRSIPAGSVVADVGCGNGKYMGLNTDIHMVGCDLSQPLVDICVKRGYNAVMGDAVNVPLRSGHFDVVLSIAVLHHISTVDRRLQIVRELLRLCKPDGRILLSAWAMEQDKTSRRSFPTQDVYVPWNVPSRHYKPDIAVAENGVILNGNLPQPVDEALRPKLVSSPNTEELIVVHRYCHVYVEGELEQLFTEAGSCTVLSSYYDRGNWCVLVQKT